jgi:hypothetical protein
MTDMSGHLRELDVRPTSLILQPSQTSRDKDARACCRCEDSDLSRPTQCLFRVLATLRVSTPPTLFYTTHYSSHVGVAKCNASQQTDQHSSTLRTWPRVHVRSDIVRRAGIPRVSDVRHAGSPPGAVSAQAQTRISQRSCFRASISKWLTYNPPASVAVAARHARRACISQPPKDMSELRAQHLVCFRMAGLRGRLSLVGSFFECGRMCYMPWLGLTPRVCITTAHLAILLLVVTPHSPSFYLYLCMKA